VTVAKLSDVKLTMLAWLPLPPFGPTPPDTTCLFSDGVEFWLGWYRGSQILCKGYGPHTVMNVTPTTRERVKWAKLNNLVAIFARE